MGSLALCTLVATALAAPGEADGDCPSPLMVDAALLELRLDPALDGHFVAVRPALPDLVVSIRDTAGVTVHERRVPAAAACETRAQSAAVIAFAWWQARGLPSQAGALADPTVVNVPATPTPAPAQRPSGAPWTYRGELGLVAFGPGADLAAVTAGASLGGTVRPWRSLGLAAHLFHFASVSTDLGGTAPGATARWNRWALGLGPAFSRPQAWATPFATLELLLARTAVAGEGLAVSRRAGGWVPGFRLGVGLDRALAAPLHAALDVGVVLWAADEPLTLAGAPTGISLPRLDVLARLTLAIDSRR